MTDNVNATETPVSLVPDEHFMETLKSGSYRNSAYALAELVDNSVDADAKNVSIAIVCDENDNIPRKIAVLDDGIGMVAGVLQQSCRYGVGSHTGGNSRGGKIGRYGVGMIAATFHQCASFEIFSWTNGIDVDSETGDMKANSVKINMHDGKNSVEYPKPRMLPMLYQKMAVLPLFEKHSAHGTFVIWDAFHANQPSWKTAKKLVEHVTALCGRIYRDRLAEGALKIQVATLDGLNVASSPMVEPVDPLFLNLWKGEPLLQNEVVPPFRAWAPKGRHAENEAGEPAPITFPVKNASGKTTGEFRILGSVRTEEFLKKATDRETGFQDPGNSPVGKLANRLKGVSIVREGRELSLDDRWLRSDQTQSRWIGVRVDFDSSLDGCLGVDHSKQRAVNLDALASCTKDEISERASTPEAAAIAIAIRTYVDGIFSHLKDQRKGVRSAKQHGGGIADTSLDVMKECTDTSKNRHDGGKIASSDFENPTNEGLQNVLQGTFSTGPDGADSPAEKILSEMVLKNGVKVAVVGEPGNSGAFFAVKERHGTIVVAVNQDHPFYDRFNECLHTLDDSESETESSISPEKRLLMARDIVIKMLFAFARTECESGIKTTDPKRREVERVRNEWSDILYDVLQEE